MSGTTRTLLAALLIASLPGCATSRAAPSPAGGVSAGTAPVEASPPPPPEPPPAKPPPAEPAVPAKPPPSIEQAPVDHPAAACTCAKPHPKHRHKHKHRSKVHQEREPAPPVGPEPPAPAAVVDAEVAKVQGPLTSILGENVHSPKGEDLGRVVDLLVDDDGRIRAAIIDFGGFLGVGTRRIAVDWPLLHFDPSDKDKPLTLSVTRAKLQSAPEYKGASSPKVLMPPPAPPANDAGDSGVRK